MVDIRILTVSINRQRISVGYILPLRTFLLIAVAALIPGPINAQRGETGFLDRSLSIGGNIYRYQVYVPATYGSNQRWPIILFLHGAGERGHDGLRQTQVGIASAIRQNSAGFPAIVVLPQAPADSAWAGAIAQMALSALEQTMREFHVDTTRVYLTGLSMGGYGVWYLAYRYPSRFAAIAPICGWVLINTGPFQRFGPVVPVDSGPAYEALARRLRNVPTWVFHGEVDPVVPAEQSRQAAAALSRASAPVQYTELLGIGHNAWDPAYGSARFWEWLFAQRRTP